jgi:hypothetical protein
LAPGGAAGPLPAPHCAFKVSWLLGCVPKYGAGKAKVAPSAAYAEESPVESPFAKSPPPPPVTALLH